MPTPPYLHPRRRRALIGWAVTDAMLGLIIVASPPIRFSGHAWDTAKTMPGGMATWGVVALLAGLVWLAVALNAHLLPWPQAGYLLGFPAAVLAGWHAFFWMALCFASFPHHEVALTGCVIYAGVAVNHVLFAVDQV